MMHRCSAFAFAMLLVGCPEGKRPGQMDPPPAEQPTSTSRAELFSYLEDLSLMLTARVLSPEERGWIDQQLDVDRSHSSIVREVLLAWTGGGYLEEVARDLVSRGLAVSGNDGEVDFELPGNLAAYLVRRDLPWARILTNDFCVDGQLEGIPCDTGSPVTAGVLTTRAYMKSRASRFNLTRASTLMNFFACKTYPLSEDIEPRLPKDDLILMFRADSPEDQEDPLAKEAFGNGFACYSCHGQFSAHAQMFVQFDENGLWRQEATGLQDPDGELGRSTDSLFTSHMVDPEMAAVPAGQMLGQPYQNIAEAAATLARSPEFVACQVKQTIRYALRLENDTVDQALLAEIAESLQADARDAKFADYVVESLSHPRVVEAGLSAREESAE